MKSILGFIDGSAICYMPDIYRVGNNDFNFDTKELEKKKSKFIPTGAKEFFFYQEGNRIRIIARTQEKANMKFAKRFPA